MSVKIKRDGVEAEVVTQYLQSFLDDGWVLVGEKSQDEQINVSLDHLEAQKEADDAEKALAETNAKLDEAKSKKNK